MLCVALEFSSNEAVLVLRMSKASRESRNDFFFLLEEGASLFIDKGDNLKSSRERVCALVLLPTPSGTRQFVGAHDTVDAQMHVVGSIVLFWYDKCRRLPYCRTNIDAHNTVRVLTCLEGLAWTCIDNLYY